MDQPAHRNPLAPAPAVTLVEPTLQGRSSGMTNVRRSQMFCQLASSLVDLTLVNDFSETPIAWDNASNRENGGVIARNCDRLWLVAARGIEVYRTSADAQNPLASTILTNGPLPAGASRSNNIRAYRLRVKVQTPAEFAEFDIDCNQELEVWGQAVSVTLLGPENAVQLSSADALTAVSRTNFVVDSLVAASVYQIEQTKGCNRATLTEYFRSPAGTASVIRVPRSAESVKIFQGTPLGAAPTLTWQRFVGDPAVVTAIPVGTINFVNRISDDASMPIGNETHLQTDVEPANQRLFVLHWTIRP